MNSRYRVCWCVLFSAVLFVRAAAAQKAGGKADGKSPSKTVARVTLGSGSGTPGKSVVVPLYFTPLQGVNVGRLKLKVEFVSANVKFSRIDKGIAADMGKVEVSAELKEGKNAKGVDTSTVTVLASPTSESPNNALPQGLLGYLTMQISESARPANIGLHATAESAEPGTNKLQEVQAVDAKIEVIAPGSEPMVDCFFFSH